MTSVFVFFSAKENDSIGAFTQLLELGHPRFLINELRGEGTGVIAKVFYPNISRAESLHEVRFRIASKICSVGVLSDIHDIIGGHLLDL